VFDGYFSRVSGGLDRPNRCSACFPEGVRSGFDDTGVSDGRWAPGCAFWDVRRGCWARERLLRWILSVRNRLNFLRAAGAADHTINAGEGCRGRGAVAVWARFDEWRGRTWGGSARAFPARAVAGSAGVPAGGVDCCGSGKIFRIWVRWRSFPPPANLLPRRMRDCGRVGGRKPAAYGPSQPQMAAGYMKHYPFAGNL